MTPDCRAVQQMSTNEWRLDIDAWPGPNRRKWPGLTDIVEESPDGRHVAVVYSCGEVGVNKEVGHLALLAGPPDAPRLLLRPRGLTCLVRVDGSTVRWIGARYCVVTPYWTRIRLSGKIEAFWGTLYLDVEQRKVAYSREMSPLLSAVLPPSLQWRGWGWLSLGPTVWSRAWDPMSNSQRSGAGRSAIALLGWLALTFAASATGVFVSTGGWYAGLAKPPWNPPSWLFGPVWTTLYVLMSVAAWLVWREGGWRAQKRALGLYLVQWALNALWTPIFFGMHRPGLAFAEILALDAAVLGTLIVFWRVRRLAGLLLAPYALWVLFATILNGVIWHLNR